MTEQQLIAVIIDKKMKHADIAAGYAAAIKAQGVDFALVNAAIVRRYSLAIILVVAVLITVTWWWMATHPVDGGDGPKFPDR